jgi:hypothetical protein
VLFLILKQNLMADRNRTIAARDQEHGRRERRGLAHCPRDKLAAMVEQAKKDGAKVALGGKVAERNRGFHYEPNSEFKPVNREFSVASRRVRGHCRLQWPRTARVIEPRSAGCRRHTCEYRGGGERDCFGMPGNPERDRRERCCRHDYAISAWAKSKLSQTYPRAI